MRYAHEKRQRQANRAHSLVAPEQPRIEGEALDFRDEIMAQIFDNGDPKPTRTLVFNAERPR